MNTELKKPAKNDFGKYFFKLMNNTVLGKSMENMREHRDIKLVTKEKRRNYLVSESNYHIAKFSTQNSKILTYEVWYDSVKPKYGRKAKLCYMDANSLTV